MSSYHVFAHGEEEGADKLARLLAPKPAPAPAPAPAAPAAPAAPSRSGLLALRRPTGGAVPEPFVRHGWQGAKPPPALLRQDIARRSAPPPPDYTDDEDFLRGHAVVKRQAQPPPQAQPQPQPQPQAQKRGPAIEEIGDEHDEDDEDDESEDEIWGLPEAKDPPPPAPAASPSSSSSAPLQPPPPSGHASELMQSAVREAFLSGIEQGKKMQLPHTCATCALRKERNRIAAKESRHKKRRIAEFEQRRSDVAHAANVAASRVARPPTDELEVGPPPEF